MQIKRQRTGKYTDKCMCFLKIYTQYQLYTMQKEGREEDLHFWSLHSSEERV